MRFFIDEDLGKPLADGMKGFGENVTHLLDEYPAGTADVAWLQDVGQRGWLIVTRDERIRYRPAERATLTRCRVGAFFLGGKNLTHCQLVQQLVRNWPRMKELAANTQKPFAYRVPPSGTRIELIQL
ncbi:hypothetical protein FJZ36_08300 [Candidatus Poribacteria bacterium]|nr:hypothetical protein [Candidatus Poribacteria bacterium]